MTYLCSIRRSLLATVAFLLLAPAATAAVSEDEKLTTFDNAGIGLNNSISISGGTALFGATLGDGITPNSGSAYVFRYNGSSWLEEAKLMASDGAYGHHFGESVSITGDTALVGAKRYNGIGFESGSAYVFRYNGSNWVEEAKLTASDGGEGHHFGVSVAVAGDIALVGANQQFVGSWSGSGSTLPGAAYVFRHNGSTWVEEAKLTASDSAAGDLFGGSVSIHGDAVLVGVRRDDDDGSNSGSAYVFRHNGSTWVEEAKLTASDGDEGDNFGYPVEIFGDTIAIGAYRNDDHGSLSGSAYVFRYNGSNWLEEAKLTASDAAEGDRFGTSVAIHGNTLLVGANLDDDNGLSSGSAYVFRYNGSTWVEEMKLAASDGTASNQFGDSVSVSGNTAIAGSNDSVYVFGYNGQNWGTAQPMPALGPGAIALLLSLLGATAYWRLRESGSVA